MGYLNKVQLIGNLGADPEIKSLTSGNKVANLRVATAESWKDKQTGEKKEKTQWHRVTIWGDGLVGVVEKYLKKGSSVYLEGQLEHRSWEDKDGKTMYSTEVVLKGLGGKMVMLGKSGGGGGRSDDGDPGPQEDATDDKPASRPVQNTAAQAAVDDGDEIPF